MKKVHAPVHLIPKLTLLIHSVKGDKVQKRIALYVFSVVKSKESVLSFVMRKLVPKVLEKIGGSFS
jgi:hypothetical protein